MTDPQTESGAAPLLERAVVRIEPPIDQIAPREWAALLAEGTVTGTVSADDVARVMAEVELRNLVGAATRRELEELRASRDLSRNAELVSTRRLVEQLDDAEAGWEAAGQLLRWLAGRPERRREELG